MLLKEQEDGTTRLSVRTKPGGVDATVLTGHLGWRRARAGRRCVDARCRSTEAVAAVPARSPSAWRPRSAGEPARPPRRPRRRADRRQAVRADLARRRGARPPAVVDAARRPRRDARPVRCRACCRCSSGRATRLVEYHLGAREALPGDDLLRRDVDDRRHRRRPDADRRSGPHPRGGRGGAGRVRRPAAAGAARLQRRPGRGPPRVPDGSRGRGRRSWRRATSSSTRRRCSSGTARIRRGRWRSSTSSARRGPTSGRWRATSARGSRAARTSARSCGRRRAGSGSRTRSPSTTLREHAADGPAGIERVLLPIDAGLEDLPHAVDHARTRSAGWARA